MPAATLETASPVLKVNGGATEVPVLTVEVENVLYGPSEALVVFSSDPDPATGELRDIGSFDMANAIEIGAKVGETTTTIFKGEVTSVEFEYDAEAKGSVIRVRALDKSHRLWRGTNTRTFNNAKVSDVVSTILGGAGQEREVTATTNQYTWLIQNNVSDGDYLLEMAAQEGLVMWTSNGTVMVKPRTATFEAGPTLTYGEHLTRVRISHNAASAVSGVTVHAWDRRRKEAVVVTATTYKALGEQAVVPTDVASGLGAQEAVIADGWVPDQASAQTLAQALLDQLGDAVVRVEGEAFFSDAIKVATLIEMKGFGNKFDGKFFVTAVRHRFSGTGSPAATEFICAGPTTDSFAPFPAAAARARPSPRQRSAEVLGPMIGIVTNAEDPENMGRVKVKLPQLGSAGGTEIESDWMRYVAPMGGKGVGAMFLPDVGDEVLVVFEHGLVEHGYVLGGVWGATDTPPLTPSELLDGGRVMRRYFQTAGGMIIDLSEVASGTPGIILQDKDGNVVKILTKDKKIVIDSQQNTVTIDAGGNRISLESQGDVEINAKNKVTIKGQAGVEIESAGGNFEAKGMSATMQGQAQAAVRGAQVAVEGQGQATVKAPMVMIN